MKALILKIYMIFRLTFDGWTPRADGKWVKKAGKGRNKVSKRMDLDRAFVNLVKGK